MTISEKQLNANRGNAKKSTGPRTTTGKNVARNNALKHGLRASTTVVVGDENQQHFEEFHAVFMEDLTPIGTLEELLAGRIITLAWRLNRITRIESGLINNRMNHGFAPIVLMGVGKDVSQIAEAFESHSLEESLEKLYRYETSLERALLRMIDKLESLQAKRQRSGIDQRVQISSQLTDRIVAKVFPEKDRRSSKLPEID